MHPQTYVHLYIITSKYRMQEENKKENAFFFDALASLSTIVGEPGKFYLANNLCF